MDYSNFKFPKVSKAKKQRKKTSEKTYKQVLELCKEKCALCASNNWLEYHHIYYRSERKDLIDEPENGIILCKECHLKVHSNKKYWQNILKDIRKKLTH